MNHIITLEQLTEALDNANPGDYAKIIKNIRISSDDLDRFKTWSTHCYTRNCIARTEKYELILLCWDIGAKAPVHGHGGEECWVYQIQGTVEEKRFEEESDGLKVTNQVVLTPGKLTYMNDRMGYHSIENISDQRALTLHIYTSPIDNCKVYNTEKGCFEMKNLSYHTFHGASIDSIV